MHSFSGLAILLPEEVSETEKPLKEKTSTPETQNEADASEDAHLEIIDMDEKQNDINKSFRRFFSNIGLEVSIKKGSSEPATNGHDNTIKEEPNLTEDPVAAEHTDRNITQETHDPTTFFTLTDVTPEDALEKAEKMATATKEEVEFENEAEAAMTSCVEEQQDAAPEEEPHNTSPTSPEDEVVVSPIKRFFATGIFSGLRKKKKLAEEDTADQEQEVTSKKEVVEVTEQTAQDQEQDVEVISPAVAVAAVEGQKKENEVTTQMTDERKASIETEISSPQEKEKVPPSPLKLFLSGSSLRKLSKTQRSRRSSDAKLSDSGEPVVDQIPPPESAENHKEGAAEAPKEEEEGAWASFKKLMTPKKRIKKSSNEESQIPCSGEDLKQEKEQMSDHSTEESKKRKDSVVSWEAVLCGSGRRRSRKTSDSEDETPQVDHKPDGGSKHDTESPVGSLHEKENLASSSKRAESPFEGDSGSAWNSLKRMVTPKRKSKDEDERIRDNTQSDGELAQEDSSFSIKKLLPGRKKRRFDEKQVEASSDEADKDVASDDEDSETPAVVPLSEYNMDETDVHIQAEPSTESPTEGKTHELQQDLGDEMVKPVAPSVPQDSATSEEPEDISESVSEHHLLSDIPEEGIITETMATPALVPEWVAADETIAEDPIEITSEAITAPEPASDITLEDETEMISAVSQLTSESSKTSGNTTPVQAEYDIVETDKVLLQVVETLSTSPKSVPLVSKELFSENLVSCVSQHPLEAFEKKEPTILELHGRSDATAFKTGLSVEELDAINKLAAESMRESISEVNGFIQTEVVQGVASEKFDTADIAVDEIQEASVTQSEESTHVLDRVEESHPLVSLEIVTPGCEDILPEGDKLVTDVGAQDEALDAETKPATSEVDSGATTVEERPSAEVEKLEESSREQVSTLDSHDSEDSLQTEEALQGSGETHPPSEENVDELETNAEPRAISPGQTAGDEPKKTIEPYTSLDTENDERPVKPEHVDEPEVLHTLADPQNREQPAKDEDVQKPESVQAPTLESEEASIQSLDQETISETVPEAETVAKESKEEPVLPTTVNLELVDTSEHVQSPEARHADHDEGSVQSFEKEDISQEIQEAETVTGEHTEETQLFTEDNLVPEITSKSVQKSGQLEADHKSSLKTEESSTDRDDNEVEDGTLPKTEIVTEALKEKTAHQTQLKPDASSVGQEGEVCKTLQTPSLKSEESSAQLLESESISEKPCEDETAEDIPKEKTLLLSQVNDEPVRDAHTTQEPDVQVPLLHSEVNSICTLEKEGVSEAEAATEEPEEETIPSQVHLEQEDVSKTVQEAEPKEKTQTIPQNVQIEQGDSIAETVEEFQSLTAVYVSSVKKETNNVVLLGKPVFHEETAPPCPNNATVTDEPQQEVQFNVMGLSTVQQKEDALPDVEVKKAEVSDEPRQEVQLVAMHVSLEQEKEAEVPCPETKNAAVTDEPQQEVHLSAEQVSFEQEKESQLPGTQAQKVALEYTTVTQVVVCDIKERSVVLPDVLIEKTAEISEPLIEAESLEQEFKEEIEIPAPFVKDEVWETSAKEADMVVMMKAASVRFEDNHRIQVQVFNADVKSAETNVDSVLKVGVTDANDIIDVCHETVEEADHLSATAGIEEESATEEKEVTVQEVTHHVPKEDTVSESAVNLEEDDLINPDAVRRLSKTCESELSEVEYETAGEESQDEDATIASETTKQRVSSDLLHTPDIQESSEGPIHDLRDDPEDTKVERENSKEDIPAEEGKLTSGISELETSQELEQALPNNQSPTETSDSTEPVTLQSPGIILSTGNVESLSGLSLELKLNIQLGQPKAPASLAEITSIVKQTDVSEVRVKAEEPVTPMNTAASAQSQEHTQLTEAGVQAVEGTEQAAYVDSAEEVPVPQDVNLQVMEAAEPEEQPEPTDRVTSSFQATEQKEVLQSQVVLLETCYQEEKAEEPTGQKEEEADQDVWMDAEEVISSQEETEMSFGDVEETLEPPTTSEQEEQARLEHEAELVTDSKISKEAIEQEMGEASGAREADSEDFAVALEHQETENRSSAVME